MIICEYSVYGNKCPDANCILYHPPRIEEVPPVHEVNLLGEADPRLVPRDSTQTYLLMQRPSTGKVWFWNTLGYD